MSGKDFLDGDKAKIGKMFMIDRVELVASHQTHQMREFQRQHTMRFEEKLQPADKIVQIGHLGQHVIA